MSTPALVESIFFAALELKTAAERAEYLDAACGADAVLRLEVKRLLDAHPLGEHYLAQPAVDRHPFDPHGPARGPTSLTSTSGPESFSEDPGAGGDSFETPADGPGNGGAAPAADDATIEQTRHASGATERSDRNGANRDLLPGGYSGDYEIQREPRRAGMGVVDLTGHVIPNGLGGVQDGDPSRVGRYRVIRRLGHGGFGTVYLAHDEDLDRPVAVKVPNPERITHAQDIEAFLDEARTLAKLDHPHIVPVFDLGRTEDGLCFVVSKLVEGSDLAVRMGQGRPSFRDSAQLVATVADALHYAHTRGLVHRDIKPANILIDAAGKPCVADFGRALKDEDFGKGAGIAGTPAYMSPEQARGEGHRVDGRSDIFSLGVVFYQLLTGERPFRGDSLPEIIESVKTTVPRRPREIDATIPRELERISLKALAKRASERYTTALDMAEDLRFFLDRAAGPAASSNLFLPDVRSPGTGEGRALQPATTSTLGLEQRPIKIIPKGLRSFDEHDTDFFLGLVPGPRDRDGLPESIRFWKTRIDSTNPDKSFRVGLIYGPSGCGKSSLVKAGLLPRLAKHVLPVYIEATPEETESRLLNGLRKVCHELPPDADLVDSLAAIRTGRALLSGQKLLLVLDQLEQWLHANRGEQNSELVAALRQCDGEHAQALVMVRDDFWMGATSFFDDLETELILRQTAVAVDLFDPRHARKVLWAFGTAYGRLPEETGDISSDQNAFLDQAISGLVQDGKIISVRLALFAEMVKGKPWTPASLGEVGGTEGVGLTFLEEAFSAGSAPPMHRFHQKAAQAILKALLPATGTDIKGQMRSRQQLLEASGYANRVRDFDDLIHILDPELRLITPTDPEGSSSDGQSTTDPALRYYQLTHDYLVHSLRDWLTRKQRDTRRGRAELLLAERSASWNAKPENRHLPSALEWANIRLLTRKKDSSEPQRKMMNRAGRVHGVRGLIAAAILSLFGWAGYEINGQLKAQRLQDKLLGSPLAQVPGIIAEVKPYRRWANRLLRQTLTEAEQAGNSQKTLHASLALLEVDDQQLPYLNDRLLGAEADDISVIRHLLAAHKNAIVPECWQVLEKPTPENQGKALQAASALALYDPMNPLWEQTRIHIADRLVDENAFVVARWIDAIRRLPHAKSPMTPPPRPNAGWIDALRPVANWLRDPLIAVFRDENREEFVRTLAASALAEYSSDQPANLAGLLMDATENQFAALYPSVEVKSVQTAFHLEEELRQKPPDVTWEEDTGGDYPALDKFYKRQANAAAALFRMGRTEKSWSVLKHSPDPSLRSYLVDSLGHRDLEPGFLIAKLDQDRDVSIRRALILTLGQYEKGRFSSTNRTDWSKKLLDLYRNDPDPGIHGASEWLLRQWGNENQIQLIDKELGKLPLPRLRVDQDEAASTDNIRGWYVNSQGHTMVIVSGPVEFQMGEGETQHRERIARSFAIASKEVTVEQFDMFLEDSPGNRGDNKQNISPFPTCPVNSISWYLAAAYCNWLSNREGIPKDEWCYYPNDNGDYHVGMKLVSNPEYRTGYRLPTEAEWEFACRAGASTAYSFGEPWELLEKYSWYAKNSPHTTQRAGGLKPNDLGLFDLQGNVLEWCQDPLKAEYGKIKNTVQFAIDRTPRSLRGGSFIDTPALVRSARSFQFEPSLHSAYFGFRPARTIQRGSLP